MAYTQTHENVHQVNESERVRENKRMKLKKKDSQNDFVECFSYAQTSMRNN